MTKKICVLFTIILMSIAGYCQPAPQNWNWYFGNHAALNFSSGSPVAVAGSAMDAEEGSASISDSNGNLLFYTNGISVWNRNNIQMPNGSGLLGDNSSTQSALIIPHPDSTNIYYIFTSAIGGNPNGYNYSEVDMTLDSARGDITVKNIHLFDSSSEKLTAIKNCNNNKGLY